MNVPVSVLGLVIGTMATLPTLHSASAEPDQAEERERTLGLKDGLPEYDAQNLLLLPKNYREWVFVGSSLGLSYSAATDPPKEETFKHVYVNPLGYREYQKRGEFPVGTMFMLEIAAKGTKVNPALQGSFSSGFIALEAAVKSGDRFDEPWTYYSFDGEPGEPRSKAHRFTGDRCISCHRQHAETDHVFTQFYPVLREAREKK